MNMAASSPDSGALSISQHGRFLEISSISEQILRDGRDAARRETWLVSQETRLP